MLLPSCENERACRRCSSLAATSLLQQQSFRCGQICLPGKLWAAVWTTLRMQSLRSSLPIRGVPLSEQGATDLLVPVDEIALAFWEETEWGQAMREQLDDKPFAK